jgi:glycosyltransferase involved in cell wall biosynthesis
VTAPLTQPHELRGRRVLVIGTFDPTTPRARQWFRLLDRLGCDVEVMNVGSWGTDRASDTAGSPRKMLRNVLTGLLRGVRHLLTCRRPDLVVFLYPGHVDACVLGPIARLRRVPTVLDVFISLHDTVIVDRGLRSTRSPVAFATRALDTLACWSVQSVVVDTPEHADFFARFTRRNRSRFSVLWVGAEEERFVTADDPGDDAPILWYLTYIPLHGVATVAHAAALLAADGATFRLVGDGQQRAAAEQLARELGLTNIEFVAPVPESELPAEIARASICLGVFGASDKAARVVPNKVFQCAASGRAIVTAATPAVINAFGDALVTVPVGDPAALADALRELRGAPRLAVAARGRAMFEAQYSEAALADDLGRILAPLLGRPVRG